MKLFRLFWTTHKWVGICASLLVVNTVGIFEIMYIFIFSEATSPKKDQKGHGK